MDKKLIPMILIGLLAVSVLISGVFTVIYVTNVKSLRTLQSQASFVNNRQNLARALLTEAVEYSKRNPAIKPVLQSVGVPQDIQPAPAPNAGQKNAK